MNLNQITLPSRNLEKSAAFYQTLGLKLIVDSIPRYARFECPDGDSTLSLHHAADSPSGPGVVVYFERNDLDAYVTKLQTVGIRFDMLPTDQDWLWREAHLSDPDGNRLILYHAGPNRKNPPWRI